jgi:hypothetical protein
MKIKVFRAISGNQHIENYINTWLAENPGIEVVSMTQSDSGGDDECGLTISILYKKAS